MITCSQKKHLLVHELLQYFSTHTWGVMHHRSPTQPYPQSISIQIQGRNPITAAAPPYLDQDILALPFHQQVVWLEVKVNHSRVLVVQVGHAQGCLQGNQASLAQGEGLAGMRTCS
jgi:hypothetical protein